MKKLVAFPYYGGKNLQLSWLLELLPYSTRYVEPFGGSAAVLLNREPSKVEVYNDLNGGVVNFFRVLREKPVELSELLKLTPYSRGEFTDCRDREPTTEPLEQARRWFVLMRQSFMSNRRNWATSLTIRNGWSQMLSRWANGILALEQVATRFLNVIIECRPAIEVISLYDSEETFQYLDPPYLPETRVTKKQYECEMSYEEHVVLLDQIQSSDSKIAISGYSSDLYNEALKDWFRYEDRLKNLAGRRGKRQEILWTNYDPSEIRPKFQTTVSEFE